MTSNERPRPVDLVSLLDRERELARREERRRLARDLHDAVVQQVFSISMQARSMEVLGRRGDAVPAGVVRRYAEEVGGLASAALAELRATVSESAPATPAPPCLREAIRTLVESVADRSGVRFSLSVGSTVDDLGPDRAEDLRRIVAEAVRNVEKHADAGRVTLRLAVRGRTVVATVSDDGTGLPAGGGGARPDAFGLTSMRERAERWGGTLDVRARPGGGTTVRAVLPLPGAPAPDLTRDGTERAGVAT